MASNSPSDLAVLEAEFADQSSSDSLIQQFVYSERSILHDLLHLGFPKFDALKELTIPDWLHSCQGRSSAFRGQHR